MLGRRRCDLLAIASVANVVLVVALGGHAFRVRLAHKLQGMARVRPVRHHIDHINLTAIGACGLEIDVSPKV